LFIAQVLHVYPPSSSYHRDTNLIRFTGGVASSREELVSRPITIFNISARPHLLDFIKPGAIFVFDEGYMSGSHLNPNGGDGHFSISIPLRALIYDITYQIKCIAGIIFKKINKGFGLAITRAQVTI
jgi:hypothetical protein